MEKAELLEKDPTSKGSLLQAGICEVTLSQCLFCCSVNEEALATQMAFRRRIWPSGVLEINKILCDISSLEIIGANAWKFDTHLKKNMLIMNRGHTFLLTGNLINLEINLGYSQNFTDYYSYMPQSVHYTELYVM